MNSPIYYNFVGTVESPNNGHIGGGAFVRCREMSAFRSVRFGRLYVYRRSNIYILYILTKVLYILKFKSFHGRIIQL